jgi:multicomponent Na+:H+ antiporter subunit E
MKYVIFFLLCMLMWLALTLNLTPANILTGLGVSLITTLLFGKMYVDHVQKFLQPRRYLWFTLYLFIFTWECIKANFDVAYRVLHPGLPVKPGIVRVPVQLKSDMAKTMLANSITMTPGTITVDILENELYVHWIYVSSQDPSKYVEKISGRFEKYIAKIFD